jgi:sensor domain DACNV-containing protein
LIRIINRHFSRESYAFDSSFLADLLETTFLASTITDEGRNVSCSISVFDLDQVITDAPEILRTDQWSILPLADPLPLTPEHLARISQAVRPHAGALAVRPTPEKRWSIWAIIDQEHLIRGFRQHNGNKFYPRAGRFQVEVDSPGCIAL